MTQEWIEALLLGVQGKCVGGEEALFMVFIDNIFFQLEM